MKNLNFMESLISSEELKNKFVDFARNSNSKLSIILGAGASFGYSKDENYPYKPPAVSQLLKNENRLVKAVIQKPEHQAIQGRRSHIERSIKSFGGDLEAYLSDIYTNDTASNLFPNMLRYLEDIFTLASQNIDLDDNNYQSLLNRVRDLRGPRPWSVLTFNYDTLLEQSLANLPIFTHSRTFLKDSNYIDLNPKILKMHGGVNLRYIAVPSPEKTDSILPHDVFTEMMSRKEPIETYLEMKEIDSSVPGFRGHRTFPDIGGRIIYNFPLMMIPIHTMVKSENSFFNRQMEYAKNEISQSKLVISIGYQFGDNTFVDSLKGLDLKESTLILVGSKNLLKNTFESKAYKEASKIWPEKNIRIYEEDGFGNFVNALY